MALKFRRGTTAQQSGSLAFGEPYVNTTLGTLLVGGASSDIQLAPGGASAEIVALSVSASSFVSASSLKVTGNAAIDGNLTLGGAITIGDASSDTVNVVASLSSSLIPQTSNAFDLGSVNKIWRDLYISTGSIKIVDGSGNVVNTITNQNLVTTSSLASGSVNLVNSLPAGTISGSSQITLQSTTGFTAYNTALSTITGSLISSASANTVAVSNLNSFTSSINTTIKSKLDADGVVSGSSQINVLSTTNIARLATTGSNIFVGDQTITGSLAINDVSTNFLIEGNGFGQTYLTAGGAIVLNPGFGGVEMVGSYRTFKATDITAEGFVSGEIRANNGVVSGSSQVVGILSSLNTYTGSNDTTNTTQNSRLDQLSTYTGSNDTTNTTQNSRLDQLSTASGSAISRLNNIELTSASLIIETTNLESFTASQESKNSSLATYTGSNDSKWSTLGSLSGSFARTNSANIFTGDQTITGSLYISQDLIVAGSSSIQNISSSRLDIGDNIIQLNVNNPSLRFGGISIFDSGSAGSSGSLLYDSVHDEFIFVHKGNGTNVTSSHFVLGPETYDDLGNETYLTQNKLVKGGGYEHIVDSNITDTGTLITLGSNTIVNGTLLASGTTLVSASAQIDHNSTTNYVANKHIDHTSVLISAGNGLSGGGDISSTRTLSLDAASATFTNGVKSKLDAEGVISSSAQLTTTFDSRYLNTGGDSIVSGSSQIDLTSTTNYSTGIKTRLDAETVVSGSKTISGITLGSNLATLTIGTGLSGTSYNGSTGVTIANTGVLSVTSNTGLSSNVSATGNVTITNTGVTSNVAGSGISVSGATGAVTITNTGVTSITGTSNQVVASASTGGVTLSLPQSIATTSTPTFGNLTINGTITATGDITAFFTSDIRHKNNVTLIDNALDKVNALNGVTWEWNDDVDEVTKQTPKTGLIAQDVLDVLPEVVKTRENGFLALDYSKMVGLLVEAIKEQDIVIQKLKTDMVQLNTTITVFEDRMKEKGLL